MKILVISQYYFPEPLRINEICEELVALGNEVTVLTMNPNYPDGEIYPAYKNVNSKSFINGVEVIRCKARPRHQGKFNLFFNYMSFMVRASCIVKKIKNEFDCIYVYQLSPIFCCVPGIIYKRRMNIPLYIYCLDVWPEAVIGSGIDKGVIYKSLDYVSKKIYTKADMIGVTSPSFKDHFITNYKIDDSRIMVLYQHADKMIKSNRNNSNHPIVNFYFIGNIGESQNLECVIRAFYISRNKNVRLNIVGSGSHARNCISLVKQLQLENIVTFHGRHPKNELRQYYDNADVCIVSLKDEGITGYTIPGKMQEYMSAGKTILGCINGDASRIINEAGCGICVPADDCSALADAINKLANSKGCLDKMGQNSEYYYLNHFTKEKHVKDLIIQLKTMINKEMEWT